jgi:hypothetical protein
LLRYVQRFINCYHTPKPHYHTTSHTFSHVFHVPFPMPSLPYL